MNSLTQNCDSVIRGRKDSIERRVVSIAAPSLQLFNKIKELIPVLINRTVESLSEVDIKREIDLLEKSDHSKDQNIKTYRGSGAFRKHIPFTTNGKPVAELVSSIITL